MSREDDDSPLFVTLWLAMTADVPVSGWPDVVALVDDYLSELARRRGQPAADLRPVQVLAGMDVLPSGLVQWRFTVRAESTGEPLGVIGFMLPAGAPTDLELDVIAAALRVAICGRSTLSAVELATVDAHLDALLRRAASTARADA